MNFVLASEATPSKRTFCEVILEDKTKLFCFYDFVLDGFVLSEECAEVWKWREAPIQAYLDTLPTIKVS